MKRCIAKDGERIDEIVWKHYGSLKPIAQILELNHKLPIVLSAGDVVLLPALEIKEEAPKLW